MSSTFCSINYFVAFFFEALGTHFSKEADPVSVHSPLSSFLCMGMIRVTTNSLPEIFKNMLYCYLLSTIIS